MFKQSEGEDSPAAASALQIAAQMTRTEAGLALQVAIEAPNIFKVAALLFPRKIRALMPKVDDEGREQDFKMLFFKHVLEKLVTEEPWTLGFSTVS